MEFILSIKRVDSDHLLDLDYCDLLKDIKNEEEAISKAREECQGRKGCLVSLCTHDGAPLVGWKILNDGTVREVSRNMLQPISRSTINCL